MLCKRLHRVSILTRKCPGPLQLGPWSPSRRASFGGHVEAVTHGFSVLTAASATMQREVELDRQGEDAELLRRIGRSSSCAARTETHPRAAVEQAAEGQSAAADQQDESRYAVHNCSLRRCVLATVASLPSQTCLLIADQSHGHDPIPNTDTPLSQALSVRSSMRQCYAVVHNQSRLLAFCMRVSPRKCCRSTMRPSPAKSRFMPPVGRRPQQMQASSRRNPPGQECPEGAWRGAAPAHDRRPLPSGQQRWHSQCRSTMHPRRSASHLQIDIRCFGNVRPRLHLHLNKPRMWVLVAGVRGACAWPRKLVTHEMRHSCLGLQGAATERSEQAPPALLHQAASNNARSDSSAHRQTKAAMSQPYAWSPDDVDTANTKAACQSPVPYAAVLSAALGCAVPAASVKPLTACSADVATRTPLASSVQLCTGDAPCAM